MALGTATNGLATAILSSKAHSTNGSHSEKPIDITADAKRVFDVLVQGGLAIVPADIGYGLVAVAPEALERAFVTKRRMPHKRHAMVGSFALHKELHILNPREAGMVEMLCQDYNMPLGVIAPFKIDHPILQKLGAETLARSSVEGTLAMLVNGGAFQDELSRLATEAELPLMGSSANLSGKGTKSLVEDIEPEILQVADIIIDYGKRKYSNPRPSSTMINFKDMELMRFGACYDVIQDVFRRFYGIEFPDDPGKDLIFSGHLREALKKD
jgi:tRNA A37 threonylcarbamoyladenosine synthetase subunit TsaC/SUA5/YrdC